jgi:ribonuclease P protein component
MLKKTSRLTTEEVSGVMGKGKAYHSSFFTFLVVEGGKSMKFAAIMSKKIGKTAVARNLARRRVYEAIKLISISQNGPAGAHIVLLCKDKIVKANLQILADDIKTLLMKAHVL